MTKPNTDLSNLADNINADLNACCLTADQVYMSDEAERKECVLNDVGMIFTGDSNYITTRPWNYGQARNYTVQLIFFTFINIHP